MTILGVVTAVGLLLTLAAGIGRGFGAALLGLGCTLLVLGLGAVLMGRSWWASIPSRKGVGLLAAGIVALAAGGAVSPAPAAENVVAAPTIAAATTASTAAGTTHSATAEPSPTPALPSSPTPTPLSGAPTTTISAASAPAAPAVGDAAVALQALTSLAVQEPATHDGYTRDQFGQAWSDDVTVDGGHNGCDTRNDILRRDLTAGQIKPGTHGCVVVTGTLADPYTGQSISFVRGDGTSEDVQIDHIVALSNAWQTGAQQLTAAERQDLANDPLNLQAVSGKVNEAKSDGDAANWLPPLAGYRCVYVDRQIQVKARYRLWVTHTEHDAMAGVLGNCAAAGATQSSIPASAPAGPAQVDPSPGNPTPVQVGPTGPAPAAYYKNCTAARAAGAAPLYRGQPGYRDQLDGDHDGVACEPS